MAARAPVPYNPPAVSAQPRVPLTTDQVRAIVERSNAEKARNSPGGLYNPLDPTAAASFIYPSNLPERRYQREIVQRCFTDNTLVCLPTGLGKCWGRGTGFLRADGRAVAVEAIVAAMDHGEVVELMGDDGTVRRTIPGTQTVGNTKDDPTEPAVLMPVKRGHAHEHDFHRGPLPELCDRFECKFEDCVASFAEESERDVHEHESDLHVRVPAIRPATYRISSANPGRDSWTCNSHHILVLKFVEQPSAVREWPADILHQQVHCFSALVCLGGKQDADGVWNGGFVEEQMFRFATASEAEQARQDALSNWRPLVWQCTVEEFLRCTPAVQQLAKMFQPDHPLVFQQLPDESLHCRLRKALHAVHPFYSLTQLESLLTPSFEELTAWVLGVWLATSCSPGSAHPAIAVKLGEWRDATMASASTRFADSETVVCGVEMGPVLARLLSMYAMDDKKQQLPHALLTDSVPVRRALLAGVIDGGGSVHSDGCYEIHAAERSFVGGLVHLARGLGLRADKKAATCVCISGRDSRTLPTLLASDSFSIISAGEEEVGCDGFFVTRVAHADYFGFQLDGNGRCLLSDFVVTHNTLVAAVLLYNMWRWFPTGKVLFVAPTRPLVLQQKEACCSLLGIPECHTAVLISNGDYKDALARKQLWEDNDQRFIFATAQSVTVDIEKNRCPLHRIVCLVVDEAHRTKGQSAYAGIIKRIKDSGHDCRIVGLSATPGKDMYAVRELCNSLHVSALELRDEDDPEVKQHLHQRDIEKVVVDQADDTQEAIGLLLNCMRPRLRVINGQSIGVNQTDPALISSMAVNTTISRLSERMRESNDKSLLAPMADLAALKRLITVRDKLKQHGVQPALDAIRSLICGDAAGEVDSGKGVKKAASPALIMLRNSFEFKKFLTCLQQIAQHQNPDSSMLVERDAAAAAAAWCDGVEGAEGYQSAAAAAAAKLPLGVHPKVRKLVELILQHFAHAAQKERWAGGDDDSDDDDENESVLSLSRGTGNSSAAPQLVFSGSKGQSNVIVFTELRDSVDEIVKNLAQFGPTIRPSAFIGQAKKSGNKAGMNQKAQAEVLRQFKDGTINTIVATSIGEEGLDIGHVDLVVSCDVLSSQLRIVQRFGRTGRKRAGRCVTLVLKGEEAKYDAQQADKHKLVRELKSHGAKPWWLQKVPIVRMLPREITPIIEYTHIKPVIPAAAKASRKRARAASVAAEAAAATAAAATSAATDEVPGEQEPEDEEMVLDVDALYAGVPAAAAGDEETEDAAQLDQAMDSLFNSTDASPSPPRDVVSNSFDAANGRPVTPPGPSCNASAAVASSSASRGSAPASASKVPQPLSKTLEAAALSDAAWKAQERKQAAMKSSAGAAAPAQSNVQTMFGRQQAQQQQQLLERKMAREAKKAQGAPRLEYSFEQLFILSEDEAREQLLGYKPSNTCPLQPWFGYRPSLRNVLALLDAAEAPAASREASSTAAAADGGEMRVTASAAVASSAAAVDLVPTSVPAAIAPTALPLPLMSAASEEQEDLGGADVESHQEQAAKQATSADTNNRVSPSVPANLDVSAANQPAALPLPLPLPEAPAPLPLFFSEQEEASLEEFKEGNVSVTVSPLQPLTRPSFSPAGPMRSPMQAAVQSPQPMEVDAPFSTAASLLSAAPHLAAPTTSPAPPPVPAVVCSVCHQTSLPGAPLLTCSVCQSRYHACWEQCRGAGTGTLCSECVTNYGMDAEDDEEVPLRPQPANKEDRPLGRFYATLAAQPPVAVPRAGPAEQQSRFVAADEDEEDRPLHSLAASARKRGPVAKTLWDALSQSAAPAAPAPAPPAPAAAANAPQIDVVDLTED